MTGPSSPQLFVVTGIMAAGKSTVAQALAERFPRAVHVRGDTFRKFVVAGREEMSDEPSEEAFAQLRLRYRLAAQTAEAYLGAGFTVVAQDVMIGPMLDEALAMYPRPLALVVLAPTPEVVATREAGRPKSGYGAVTPADLDIVLRKDTTKRGLWIDTSVLTVEETVDQILSSVGEALI